jgi:hypothetical protein
MKQILTIFTLLFIFNFVNGQNCFLDSLNNKKVDYNSFGKASRIHWNTIWYLTYTEAVFYEDLNYINDTVLKYLLEYGITIDGDTVYGVDTTKVYEYTNGKLSKIAKPDVVLSDIVWNDNNQITEYKYYYYQANGTIDSTRTRIIIYSYQNNNVHRSIYRELSGFVFHDIVYSYDNKINPFYQSEIDLAGQFGLTDYCQENNWVSYSGSTGSASQDIIYNSFNYPVSIEVNYSNGNSHTETLAYQCDSTVYIDNNKNNFEFEIYPNPSYGVYYIQYEKDINPQNIKVFDLKGIPLEFHVENNKIEIESSITGMIVFVVNIENKKVVKKVIKNAR